MPLEADGAASVFVIVGIALSVSGAIEGPRGWVEVGAALSPSREEMVGSLRGGRGSELGCGFVWAELEVCISLPLPLSILERVETMFLFNCMI